MPPIASAARLALLLGLPALVGCNKYELFALAGYEQASFQNDADVLFIVDNSPSMEEEAAALGLNFQLFIQGLADPNAGGVVTENLSDAVDNYVSYTTVRGSVLDYQLAITTTTVDPTRSTANAIDPGEAGTFIGPVIARGSASVVPDFLDQLLCQTTNWNSTNLPEEDSSYTCGQEGMPAFISAEYLDCLCGEDAWKNNQGGGTEQPLEAALLALCRAAEDPPEVCYHQYAQTDTQDSSGRNIGTFDEQHVGMNGGFLREGATTVIAIVTDEGDSSSQFLANGEDDPSPYLDAFAQFDNPVRIAVIGPRLDTEALQASACAQGTDGSRDTVPYWSVKRLYTTALSSGGFYADITQGGDTNCAVSDFSVHLDNLGALLVNLVNAFELRSIPDPSTIRVFVDGEEIDEAVRVDDGEGDALYDNGWTYEPAQNAVVFWGTAVPDYNADVQIYYRPLEGRPRELPF